MPGRPLRIGVVGGTFDPPHNGHVVVAASVAHQLALDLTLLVVANEPWQKVGERTVTPARHRLAMVQLVADEIEVPGRRIEASSIEIDRGGPTYTADTLAALGEQHPGSELWLVVGTDVANALDTWRRLDEVRDRAGLALIARGGEQPPVERLTRDGWRTASVTIPRLDISSNEIRQRLARGDPVDGLVPAAAIRYLRRAGLYAPSR